jgi:intracellular multiplication protein IcmD
MTTTVAHECEGRRRMSRSWRVLVAVTTAIGMVVLASNAASASQAGDLAPAGGGTSHEEQVLLQATGPAGSQLLSSADALLRQLGIASHSEPFNSSDVGSAAKQVRITIADIARLISSHSYVAGFAFALAAIAKFKAHKDNPTQVPISLPIALLFVAAALIFIPAIFGSTDGKLIDPHAVPGLDGVELLNIVAPVVASAKAHGLTRSSERGPVLPRDAKATIRTALSTRGFSGRTLDAMVRLGELMAQALVAGARR